MNLTFTVEDGSGVAGANSYTTEDVFDDYTDLHAYAVTVGDTEAALVRASTALDGTYRHLYPGTRTNGRDQGLDWPRTGAVDMNGVTIPDDEIPQEIIDATCELALRELNSPGSTLPDTAASGQAKRLKAGSVEIEFWATSSGGTAPLPSFSNIDAILGSLLPIGVGGTSGMQGTATRG